MTEQKDDEPKGEEDAVATPPTTAEEGGKAAPVVVDEPPKDEEGLLLEYDVVLCGTGLVQSILASALTRNGKTVLHCDGNDHYGELDTVWTLDYLKEMFENGKKKEEEPKPEEQQDDDTKKLTLALDPRGSNQNLRFHSLGTKTEFPVTEIGTKVETSYGEGTITGKTIPTAEKDGSLEVSLDKWTMADGKSPKVFIGVTLSQLSGTTGTEEEAMEEHFQASSEVQSLRALAAQRILQEQSRSLAIDATPCLLYASGVGVQGMITSNVAEHLEFQTMQGMYWLADTTGNSKLERVPCSKGDVMQSSLLPGLDKRRFMKFFQSAMDYATEREMLMMAQSLQADDDAEDNNTEEGVLSLNERQLNQGRSLARPQNKAMAKKDLQALYDCMEQNMDFDKYLADHAKLSPQLRQLVRHALALDTTTTATSSSSGDENTQPSLSTHEGMGRLCDHLKALGRFGTTAFLTPLYGSGELPQFFCRSAAVYGATYLLRRVPQNVTLAQDGSRVEGVTMGPSDGGFGPPAPEKHIKASHVVVAQDAKAASSTSTACERRLLRRVGLLRGTLVPGESRAVLIVPPSEGDNHNAIHGLVLDETTKVAPYGCSVLHLTTVVDGEGVETNNTLEQAVQALLKSAPEVDEIFHATFSYGLHEDDVNTDSPAGLHLIQRNAMPLVVDEAFLQAKKIFATICGPNAEFLAISEQMEAKLKEQLQGAYRGPNQSEDDTEQVALDSAMEMIEETKPSEPEEKPGEAAQANTT